MPNYVDTTTLALYGSVSETDQPVGTVELTPAAYDAASLIPQRYRQWNGSAVVEMTQPEKDAVDAALLAAAREALATRLDTVEDELRAFALTVLDELNLHAERITAILDAIDAAGNLGDVKTAVAVIPDVPQRTIAQLRTSVRNKLGT